MCGMYACTCTQECVCCMYTYIHTYIHTIVPSEHGEGVGRDHGVRVDPKEGDDMPRHWRQVRACVCVCMYVCVCVWGGGNMPQPWRQVRVCVYVCMCVCMYVCRAERRGRYASSLETGVCVYVCMY